MTLKITTERERTMFGKPNGIIVAKIGETGFTARGTSKKEATQKLEKNLTELARHEMTRRYLITGKGTVFNLWHSSGCWGYDIIHTEKPGAYSSGSCLMGSISFVDAYAKMKSHWEALEADAQ